MKGSGVKSVDGRKSSIPTQRPKTIELTLQGDFFVGNFYCPVGMSNRMPADVSRWFMAVVIKAEDKQ
jgi:hypothetical protein